VCDFCAIGFIGKAGRALLRRLVSSVLMFELLSSPHSHGCAMECQRSGRNLFNPARLGMSQILTISQNNPTSLGRA